MRWTAALFFVLAVPVAAQSADAPVADAAGVYDYSEVVPELIGGIAALQQGIVYPDADRRAGVQGRVIVQFVVDEAGTPVSIVVARGISPGLDSAAVAAVRAARFTTGMQEGRPVKVRFTLPVSFRIAAPQAGLDVDALVGRLGRPWSPSDLPPPDSGAVTGGTGRLLWRSTDGEIERVLAFVVADTLREIETTAAPGSGAIEAVRRLADTIGDQPGLSADSAGFYTAAAMAAAGFVLPRPRDVRIDLDRRAWTYRARACRSSEDGPREVAPVLIGGIRHLQSRLRYPEEARRDGLQGRVYVQFVVAEDGTPRDVAMARDAPTSGPAYRLLHDEALRAVREARFLPGTQNCEPVSVLFALPITFNILD